MERASERVLGRGKGVADIDTAGQGKLLIGALKGKEKEDGQLPNQL